MKIACTLTVAVGFDFTWTVLAGVPALAMEALGGSGCFSESIGWLQPDGTAKDDPPVAGPGIHRLVGKMEVKVDPDGQAWLLFSPSADQPAQALDGSRLRQDREDLLAAKASVQKKIDDIQAQLDRAKAENAQTKAYKDADWFRRAQYARREAGRRMQRINTELTRVKRGLHELNAADQAGQTPLSQRMADMEQKIDHLRELLIAALGSGGGVPRG